MNSEEENSMFPARYGINKFSDWSEQEFRGLYLISICQSFFAVNRSIQFQITVFPLKNLALR